MALNKKNLQRSTMALWPVLAASVVGLCAAGTASAQTSDAQAAASADEVVVTAQRQSQNQQNVPLSVTAVSAQTIENLNLRNVDAVSVVTPGVVLDTAFSFPTFYMRGVGAQNRAGIGLETPVAIYIDGAYLPRNTGTPFDLYDVSSVQVLKGPQGTLYGRNASGGTILIETARPEAEFGANLAAEVGNFGHRQVDAMINAPLSDKLSFRIAGRYRDDDGFVTNVFDGRDVRGRESYDLRAKMLWEPNADFAALLTFDYHHDEGLGLAAAREDSVVTRTSSLAFDQVNSDFIIHEPSRSNGVNLNLQYNRGSIKLTNIVSFHYASARLSDDNEHSSIPAVAINAVWGGKTLSEDFQIASSFGGAFDFLAGLSYANDDASSNMNLYGAAFGIPYSGEAIPAGAIVSNQFVETDSYGAFAELYIRPIEHMTVTLGGRYSRDERRLTSRENATSVSIFGGPAASSQDFSDNEFTPRAVLAYDLGNTNLYVSYTRGYLAGGFNIPVFSPQAPLLPETISSYEIGAKYVSDDRRTRLNLAAFHYDYEDLQVSTCCATGQAVVLNAASAEGDGFEADLFHRATSWLSFSLGAAYLDTSYDQFKNASVFLPVFGDPMHPTTPTGATQGTLDLSGTALPRSPEWTAYANVDLEAPITSALIGRLNLSVRYASEFDFNPGAGGPLQTDRQDSLTLVNMTGGVGPSSKAWEVGFYVDNLTDEHYYANRAISASGLDSRIAVPRSYGLRFRAQM